MKGKLNDRDAQCPFFSAHTRDSVFCESMIPDSHVKLHFDSVQKKKLHYEVFCCCRYKNCELYEAIMKTYQEDEERGGE